MEKLSVESASRSPVAIAAEELGEDIEQTRAGWKDELGKYFPIIPLCAPCLLKRLAFISDGAKYRPEFRQVMCDHCYANEMGPYHKK